MGVSQRLVNFWKCEFLDCGCEWVSVDASREARPEVCPQCFRRGWFTGKATRPLRRRYQAALAPLKTRYYKKSKPGNLVLQMLKELEK